MDKILIADDNVQITRILSEFAKRRALSLWRPLTATKLWNCLNKILLP